MSVFDNVPCYKCSRCKGYGFAISFEGKHVMIVYCRMWDDPVEWDCDEKGYCDFFFPSDIKIEPITFITENEMQL